MILATLMLTLLANHWGNKKTWFLTAVIAHGIINTGYQNIFGKIEMFGGTVDLDPDQRLYRLGVPESNMFKFASNI